MQTKLNRLNHEQIYNLIRHTGHKRTALVTGPIGCGKSSLLNMFRERKPTTPSGLQYEGFLYFDATTKEAGDILIPDIVGVQHSTTPFYDDPMAKSNIMPPDGTAVPGTGGKSMQALKSELTKQVVRFIPNEELGFHIDGPIVLMIDEGGKATPPVKNGIMRVALERKLAVLSLHPESIVFVTSNLSAEGTGDVWLPHQLDRLDNTEMGNGSNMDWINWAIDNDIDDSITAFAYETPELFQSFLDVNSPSDNEFIQHPQAPERTAFVTNRSLAGGDIYVKQRHLLDDTQLEAGLSGCWGNAAASEFIARLHLRDKMPSMDQIKDDPMHAPLPDNSAAACALIMRSLRNMSREFCPKWMAYLGRMDHGMQALFCTASVADLYKHKKIVVQNDMFRQWAMKNRHVFDADIEF